MTDIAELFSRDPLTFNKETKEEVRAIVTKLRESRSQYNLGSMKAGSMKAPATKTAKAAASIGGGLKLDLSKLLNKQ